MHPARKSYTCRISIHAPREGSDSQGALVRPGEMQISIHAPREGSDQQDGQDLDAVAISIHAPREGSDGWRRRPPRPARHFYPRSPRGERPPGIWSGSSNDYFYPRSPRGERPGRCPQPARRSAFLSTLPARGATGAMRTTPITSPYFYPRSPRGERPGDGPGGQQQAAISIHAPREGSDRFLPGAPPPPGHFYPRSPRGERPPSAL